MLLYLEHHTSVVNEDLTFNAKAKDLTHKAKAKDLTFKDLTHKAKDLTLKAKAKDLTHKAKDKDLTLKAKDSKFVLEDTSRPRTTTLHHTRPAGTVLQRMTWNLVKRSDHGILSQHGLAVHGFSAEG